MLQLAILLHLAPPTTIGSNLLLLTLLLLLISYTPPAPAPAFLHQPAPPTDPASNTPPTAHQLQLLLQLLLHRQLLLLLQLLLQLLLIQLLLLAPPTPAPAPTALPPSTSSSAPTYNGSCFLLPYPLQSSCSYRSLQQVLHLLLQPSSYCFCYYCFFYSLLVLSPFHTAPPLLQLLFYCCFS